MQQLNITDLGKILGIWAHPDDEVFSSAGIMATAVQNGQDVACITATRGEMGVQDSSRWPADRLGQIRTKELDAAYSILEVNEHVWLDYRDGECEKADQHEAIKKVRTLVEKYSPDTILTFGPDGMTGHPDHQTVSHWATTVAEEQDIRIFYAVLTPAMYDSNREADQQFDMFFNIEQPPIIDETECDVLLKLGGEILDKKCNALQAMPSQTALLVDFLGYDKLCEMLNTEAFVRA